MILFNQWQGDQADTDEAAFNMDMRLEDLTAGGARARCGHCSDVECV